MAAAAGRQNRLWQFVDLVYRNLGEENAGWVNDSYLRRIAAAAGLDVGRAFSDRSTPAVRRAGAGEGRGKRGQGVVHAVVRRVTTDGRPGS